MQSCFKLPVAYTILINDCLAILKSLRCLQLKKELNNEKRCVKMSHVLFNVRLLFSFSEKL